MSFGIGSALIIVWIVLIATFLVVFLRPTSGQAVADLDSHDPGDDRAAWRDARAERRRPPTRAKARAAQAPRPARATQGRSLFSPSKQAPGTR